jgi:hypothetical protein
MRVVGSLALMGCLAFAACDERPQYPPGYKGPRSNMTEAQRNAVMAQMFPPHNGPQIEPTPRDDTVLTSMNGAAFLPLTQFQYERLAKGHAAWDADWNGTVKHYWQWDGTTRIPKGTTYKLLPPWPSNFRYVPGEFITHVGQDPAQAIETTDGKIGLISNAAYVFDKSALTSGSKGGQSPAIIPGDPDFAGVRIGQSLATVLSNLAAQGYRDNGRVGWAYDATFSQNGFVVRYGCGNDKKTIIGATYTFRTCGVATPSFKKVEGGITYTIALRFTATATDAKPAVLANARVYSISGEIRVTTIGAGEVSSAYDRILTEKYGNKFRPLDYGGRLYYTCKYEDWELHGVSKPEYDSTPPCDFRTGVGAGYIKVDIVNGIYAEIIRHELSTRMIDTINHDGPMQRPRF